jgi:hypothetical protein
MLEEVGLPWREEHDALLDADDCRRICRRMAGQCRYGAASGSSAFSGIRICIILRHPDLHHFAASESASFCGIRICIIFAASGSASFCGIQIRQFFSYSVPDRDPDEYALI